LSKFIKIGFIKAGLRSDWFVLFLFFYSKVIGENLNHPQCGFMKTAINFLNMEQA
jgi:glutaredoxin-related protein